MAAINDRIKERRLKKGFTLLEIAEQLDIKEATMQRYESGEIKNIKHETVVKLAEILECSPEYLMGWTDQMIRLNKYAEALGKLKNRGDSDETEESNPLTIAAHKENNESWTPEELQKIEEYKQLLLAARNSKK